ncbi:hypothetical protein LXM94_20250 [Rhizobium sp. TRM95111]|uniref:hypothetical protein n=1 Tax=Rhizobium alarense TaxID=2846851 RepID=UPI001F42FBDF|nr:hypothetical protein [Rhizobium alarense]MCF3642306.1 hypothetical protein [Rhizobium alarense]
MPSETIIAYIDPAQIAAQKNNQFSLYLAKKVNGQFTVIWQSMGPIATVNTPSYEYENTFNIAVPSYQVNYGNVTISEGTVSFTSAGDPVNMNIGQVVALDQNGVFGTPQNGGPVGALLVNNSLQGNPHEVLADSDGNPIFVNVDSGMDIGQSTLTPIDQYQIWFDNFQQTGTIIAENVSNAMIVTFDGGSLSQTISYTADGQWQQGPLPPSTVALSTGERAATKVNEIAVIVAATFTAALTTAAVTYLLSKLIDKFSGGLKPSHFKTSVGSLKLEMTFDNKKGVAAIMLDQYEQAVNAALAAAVKDKNSPLAGESWTLSETDLVTSF